MTWTQTENPFSIYDSAATVTNFLATLNGEKYTYKNDNLFAGLSVSSGSATLLDGNVGGWWFYSVGNNQPHGGENGVTGNPALIPFSATLSELYICQPKETTNKGILSQISKAYFSTRIGDYFDAKIQQEK